MAYRSLSHFISALEDAGELVRIKEFVSPYLEMTEITDRVVKHQGKALLFENTGTGFPVLINAFGSRNRMCTALGVTDLDEIGNNLENLLKKIAGPKETFADKLKVLPALKEISSYLPKILGKKGTCQEVVMKEPDLRKLPVLTCWPADGGPFFTLPVVHTRNPDSGIRNVGMYRMQVMGPKETGMHWHLHKGAASHYREYKETGKRMPVTVTLGGDPVYTYVATAPLPENLDEYLFAGFIRKKKVEMVRCLTNELEVPADADFVIEGYIDPAEELVMEGPFGDHTGFYSLADLYPKFHVTCITHRKNAVYPATVVGIPPMEDEWMGKATERIFLMPLRSGVVPELKDINMPMEGVFHNIVITAIRKTFPGQAMKVMNSLWGAGQMMFTKVAIVTDEKVNVQDVPEVIKAVCDNVDPVEDIQFARGPADVLDHSSRVFAFGSKIGLDATEKNRDKILSGNRADDHPSVDTVLLIKEIPEITTVNETLAGQGIPVLILSFRKSKPDHVREICGKALRAGMIRGIKFIVVTDPEVDIFDPSMVAWICSGNIDPVKDCFFTNDEYGKPYPVLIIDGTRKTLNFDGFEREWPNIIVMNDQTIKKIDDNWGKFFPGPFLPSPSLRYKNLVIGSKALAVPGDE
jgi:4-hydroxy-3-polyprenylbenzoate decarboxylase